MKKPTYIFLMMLFPLVSGKSGEGNVGLLKVNNSRLQSKNKAGVNNRQIRTFFDVFDRFVINMITSIYAYAWV